MDSFVQKLIIIQTAFAKMDESKKESVDAVRRLLKPELLREAIELQPKVDAQYACILATFIQQWQEALIDEKHAKKK